MCHTNPQTNAASYDELASHVGHDIKVVIYGGDQNAAVECETCATVLLNFDRLPDGTHPAGLAALVALAERHRLGESDLAEHVLEAACELGASVNNQGISAQLKYLLAENGAEDTRQVIEEIARSRRRR